MTKSDVVGHYLRVADRMLPHLAGRPVTLQRFPDGIAAKGFMQKNAPSYFPGNIGRIELPKKDGVTLFPVVEDAAGLAYLANLGTITFHMPTVRLPNLGQPDRFAIDLDPPENEAGAARWAARRVGDMLGGLGVASLPMATGSKGYHVVVKIVPEAGHERVARFAHALAVLLAQRHSAELTTEFRKKNRRGRVFIDWMRNAPMATGVAPWSLRPRPSAPVAVPLTWDEIDHVAPDQWTLSSLEERHDGADPLIEAEAVSLLAAIEATERLLVDQGIELPEFDRFRS